MIHGPKDIAGLEYAYVALVMIGDSYIPGAIVLATRLKEVKSQHPFVLMVTNDVTSEGRKILSSYVDYIVEVDYISHRTKRLSTEKQRQMYEAWMDNSFTQFRLFSLPIKKVIYLHSDMYPLHNVDHMFEMPSPSGCFSYHIAAPYGTAENPYFDWYRRTVDSKAPEIPQGAKIPPEVVREGLGRSSFTVWSAFVVVEPSLALVEMLDKVLTTEVYGEEFKTTLSAPDEIALADVTSRLGMTWTHIHQRYLLIPRRKDTWILPGDTNPIMCHHYLGTNVWELGRDEWPDVKEWWDTADAVVAANPAVGILFGRPHHLLPGDIEYTQYRLTRDVRNMIATGPERNKREADNILERWLLSMANRPREGWPTVYVITTIDDPINQKMISELVEKKIFTREKAIESVTDVLRVVNGRLSRYPSITMQKSIVTPDNSRIAYGSRFSLSIESERKRMRVAYLKGISGEENLVLLAMRYGTLISHGQQWGLPLAHFRGLYDSGIKIEGFASAWNSRFLEIAAVKGEVTAYCSVAADLEARYGSIGSFFDQKIDICNGGGWKVNPPFVEEILTIAATKVVTQLVKCSRLTRVLFLGPSWTDAAFVKILTTYPHKYRIDLARGEYNFEDSDWNTIPGPVPIIYWYLSSEPIMERDLPAIDRMMRAGLKG